MFTWASVLTFVKKIPSWVWWAAGMLFVLLATGQWVQREKKKAFEKGKDEAETKAAVESAKAETRVIETIRQIEKDTADEADRSVEIRDAVLEQPVPDVVRNAPDHIFKD